MWIPCRVPLTVLIATAAAFLAMAPAAPAATYVNLGSPNTIGTDGEPLNVLVQHSGAYPTGELRVTDQSGGTPRTSGGTCIAGATANEVVCQVPWSIFSLTVLGTPAADVVTIRPSDLLHAAISTGGGDDVVDASGTIRFDSVNLGDGNDTLYACACHYAQTIGYNRTGIDGGVGSDTISFERVATGVSPRWYDAYNVMATVESIVGSPFADDLRGEGATRIAAGAGNDLVWAPNRNASILLGDGNDRFVDGRGAGVAHAVAGGAGTDTLLPREKGDRYICLDQRSSLCGTPLDGRKNEKDKIGADVENVDMTGAPGNHVLIGSPAANAFTGGPGQDVFFGGAGRDTFVGRGGIDAVAYAYRPLQPRSVHLTADGRHNDGGPREDRIATDIEIMVGSVFGDVIVGSARNEALFGEAGNDVITAGRGSDYVDGGAGNDVINVRDGRRGDEVKCGAGRDTVRADPGDKVAADCEIR